MSLPVRLVPVLLVAAACGGAAPGVGVRTLDGVDPITRAPLPMAVVYPTARAGAPATFGEYTVAATRDAAPAAGRRPLVVISHGHAGTRWGHHDLATALARAGYVVASVEHVGDSYRDQSGVRSDRVLLGRAYQLSAAIDRVLADPALAPHIDAARIGVAGFSAGGYTALLVAGARPDFARLAPYCARHPEDHEICDGGPVRRELAPAALRPTRDARVRAAFVMAPLGIFFGDDAFREVTAPVFLTWADGDRVLLPGENAEPVARRLGAALAGTRVVAGAGHFVFLVPCPPAVAAALPALCIDPPGVDRARVHEVLAADAVRFFDERLGRAR